METESVVGSTVDIVLKDIAHALLMKVEARAKLIVAFQWSLELQLHPCHDSVHTLFVQVGKAHAEGTEKAVARMFGIVEIVGVVDDTLDVAFVVAHLHTGFEEIRLHECCVIFIHFYLYTIHYTFLRYSYPNRQRRQSLRSQYSFFSWMRA